MEFVCGLEWNVRVSSGASRELGLSHLLRCVAFDIVLTGWFI